MSDNIFDGATTPVEPVVEPQVATLPTEVAELVGEGKKYKTADEALKALPHAQKHIQTLEVEAQQLRDELAKRKAAEELLAEFKTNGFQPQPGDNQTKSDPVDVEKLVEAVLTKKQGQERAQTNKEKVTSAFIQAFGDKTKAEEVYIKLAEESNISIPELNRLSMVSPEAVLRLAGITAKQPVSNAGKVQSTINTDTFNQGKPQELSAKVKSGASTRDVTAAWRAAGEIVKQKLGNT